MAYIPSLGAQPNLIDVFKRFADTSKPLIEFHEVLLRGPSPYSEAERELIAAFVSGLNSCRYCHGVHTATAERLGVKPGVINRLLTGADSAPIPENLRPVLAFAQKLTEEPASVSQSDADAILNAGWDEDAVYHAVAVTALFNFMNRLVEGLGIKFDDRYTVQASKRLADGGYLPLLDMIGK
jgi:uncharacterized peroxidase-related enzyme